MPKDNESSALGGYIGGYPVTIGHELNLDEFWRVMRKLSGPHAMMVIDALLTGKKLTRKELRERTGLSESLLNHELIELQKLKLIIKNVDKTYQITVYCKLFMYVIDDLVLNLSKNKDILLNSAIDPDVLEIIQKRHYI